MAFRKFGGLNYATNNNIVHNTYSNTKNLTITNQVGAPNSNVLIQSNLDMSSNSLFGIGQAHFETGFITSQTGALTFDNSTSNSSGVDFNTGAGMTLRGMDFNNAAGATFRFNTTGGGAISLHNQTVSVATGDINLTAPTGQTIFIDPDITVPKITTRPGTDLFVSTGSPDGHIRVDRDVDIISDIIQIGDTIFQGNVGITGTFGVTGASTFNGASTFIGLFAVTGRSTFDGSVGITGFFGVTGRSTFDGSVGVTGLFGVTGSSTFDGAVGVAGLFGVTGASIFNGSSTFDGQVGISGPFGVTGASIFNGSVGITGLFGVTGTSTFNGYSTFDGQVGVSGPFGVTGTSTFNGSVGISGTLGVTGTSIFNGSSSFDGHVGVTGTFGVTGASIFNGSSTFDGQVGITGLFGVTGASTFNGTVEFFDYVPTCKIWPTGDYDLTNKQYVLSLASAGGVTLFNNNNVWTGTNTFNNSVAVNGPFDVTGASVFNGNVNVKNVLTLDASLALTSHPLSTLSQFDLSCLKGTTGGVIQNQLNGKVNLTGGIDESIDGVKTFSNNLTLGTSSNLVLTSSATTLSQTELSYLANASSNIQDQITARVSKTGAVDESIDGVKTFSNNLTLGTSSNLVLTSSATTLSQTELSYLANASSNIQDQITARVSKTGAVDESIDGVKTFSSDLTLGASSNLVLGTSSKLVLGSSNTQLEQTELGFLDGVSSEIVTVGTLGGLSQTILGPKTFSGTAAFPGTITGNTTFANNSTFSGTAAFPGTITGNTTFANNSTFNGTSAFPGTITGNTTFASGGATTFSGTAAFPGTITGNTTFANNSTFNGTSAFPGNITGNTTFNNNLILGSSSLLQLNSGTQIEQIELSYLNGVGSAIVTVGGASAQSITSAKIFASGSALTFASGSTVTFSGTTSFTTAISGTTTTFTGEVKAASFDATSDYRIKQNVINLDDTYKLDNLRPVSYYNTKTCSQNLGFIAHEVQQEIPHIVSGEKDGEQLQSINYNGLIPILVKELNEQKQENKQNKELINKLMQSNEYLMKHVNELIKKLL